MIKIFKLENSVDQVEKFAMLGAKDSQEVKEVILEIERIRKAIKDAKAVESVYRFLLLDE